MRKKSFIMNALFLTAATLLARIIGIAFRVYMSNKIGSEGIGLYQLICTVYMFSATFATSGITLAVTRLVTDSIANKDYATAKASTNRCLYIGLVLSVLVGSLLFFYADFIGVNFLNDARTVLSIKVLAPSLPFMAISACFRGYFFAVRKVIKTASEQLLEQIVEILVFSSIISFMLPKGMEYACCALVVGTTIAEVVSCLYSYALYKLDVKNYKAKDKADTKGIYKNIAGIALPVTASSSLRSGLSTVENILIPKGFQKNGASSTTALAGYGLISGMVMPVITFPSVFLFSFAMLLIPEMSEANAVHHTKNISYIASRVFHITLIYSIMVAGIFMFFSDDFGMSIYNSREPGVYMSLLSPIIPLMYLDSVVDGMLKGLNEQLHYLTYNIIDSTLRVILIYILLPIYGLNGLVIVMFFSTILNSSLSMNRLIKVANIKVKLIDWVIKPIACIVITCFLMNKLCEYQFISFSSVTAKLVCEIIFSIISYMMLLITSGAVCEEEIIWVKNYFKKGQKQTV